MKLVASKATLAQLKARLGQDSLPFLSKDDGKVTFVLSPPRQPMTNRVPHQYQPFDSQSEDEYVDDYEEEDDNDSIGASARVASTGLRCPSPIRPYVRSPSNPSIASCSSLRSSLSLSRRRERQIPEADAGAIFWGDAQGDGEHLREHHLWGQEPKALHLAHQWAPREHVSREQR